MKKILLLLFVLLFTGACSKSLLPDDISKISLGMDSDKVIEILGKPTIQTTDRNVLTEKYDGLSTLYATQIEFDENEEDKYRGYGEYNKVFDAINNKKNVEVYEYKTNQDNHNIYIYFLNHKVVFFYDLDLSEE